MDLKFRELDNFLLRFFLLLFFLLLFSLSVQGFKGLLILAAWATRARRVAEVDHFT